MRSQHGVAFSRSVSLFLSKRRHSSDDGASNRDAIITDSSESWLLRHVSRAVEEGRQTKESAAYFESIISDQPEFHQYIDEARRLIGDQDTKSLSRYQQAQYAERLSHRMSGIAAERMMRAHTEETNTRRHTQEGTPTGENYWMEAGNTLASPSIPSFVKDEVLREMRKERRSDSPAFSEPKEMDTLAKRDEAYAQHLRHQRKRLLSSEDHPE